MMEKSHSGDIYKRTCIGYNNQLLYLPRLNFFIVAKSIKKSSCVYSACGIFKDSRSPINCARLILASLAALPIDISFFWKRKRAIDS